MDFKLIKSDSDCKKYCTYMCQVEYSEMVRMLFFYDKIPLTVKEMKLFLPGIGIEDKNGLYAVMHEFGHVAMVNRARGRLHFDEIIFDSGMDVILDELDAWVYASKCIRKEKHNELMCFAIECMESYFRIKMHRYFNRVKNVITKRLVRLVKEETK